MKLKAGLMASGLALAAGALSLPVQGEQTESNLPPPVHLTAAEDHQRVMDLLHIKELRPGADPKHPDAANAVNYDESKVKPYKLPDSLVLNDGQRVTTPEMWWNQRRPQLLAMFDEDMYGRVPAHVPDVHWEVVSTTRETVGTFTAVTRKLIGHVDNSTYPLITVNMDFSVTTPAEAAGPVPVVIEFGWVPRKGFTLPKETGPSWKEQLLAKGWGYAVLIPTSYQADNGAGLTEGIIGLVNKGQPRRNLDEWGALRAWAWGASRALDYLETDPAVNAKEVGIEGLSRYGKAALVAMAYDQRFSIAFIASSGEGGAKPSRRNFGEIVENLAGTGEYHWMAPNFLKYGGPLTAADLPVDANELIALCAPRPVFISCGSPQVEGNWLDDKGQFEAEVSAGEVYRLLGKKGLDKTELPPIGTTLIDGDLAFRQHSGGHTAGPNWPTFIEFASRYWKTPN